MDQNQNKAIEKAARDAASGKKRYRWQDTQFEIMEAAKHTDPTKITGPSPGIGWWQHVADLVDRGLKRGRYGRDGVEEENLWPQEEIKRKREDAKDAYKFADYAPGPDEDVYGWLAELRIYVEETPERKPYFVALARFVDKYPIGTRGEAIDREELLQLLEALCSQPGGLLVRRAA
jgi:hypothetical protein